MKSLGSVTFAADHGFADEELARLTGALTDAGVEFESPTTMIRSVLDTFDGKLHRGGLRCETRAARSSGPFELVVLDRDGPDARVAVGSMIPSVDEVSSPLRDRLAAVVRGRTLEVRLTVVATLRRGTLRDTDGNTIALVVLFGDGTAAPGSLRTSRAGRRNTPVMVGVSMVAPHRSSIKRLMGALKDSSLQLIECDLVEHAMRLCEVDPAGLDTTPSIDMPTDLGAGEGVRRTLAHLTETIEATWAGTVDERDIEYLHEFRIAVRRTRTVLRACRRVVPEELVADGGILFKTLGELTGPARDLDVTVDQWTKLSAAVGADRRDSLDPVRSWLVEQRAAAHQRLSTGLRSRATRRAMDDWRARLAQPIDDEAGTIRDEIERRVRRAHRRLVHDGRAISGESPADQLHDLRKDAKKLRYLLECFGEVVDDKPRKRFVGQLKRLQDNLGEFQDSEVQVQMFERAAADLQAGGASLDTLLAIGQLIAVLEDRSDVARAAFAHRFTVFDSRETRSTFDAMFPNH